jgi:hypothetical protein
MRGEGSRPAKGKYICMWHLPAAGSIYGGGIFVFGRQKIGKFEAPQPD